MKKIALKTLFLVALVAGVSLYAKPASADLACSSNYTCITTYSIVIGGIKYTYTVTGKEDALHLTAAGVNAASAANGYRPVTVGCGNFTITLTSHVGICSVYNTCKDPNTIKHIAADCKETDTACSAGTTCSNGACVAATCSASGSCASPANSCGMTTTGTASCNSDGSSSCSATTPSDSLCAPACVPGGSCTSGANACGMTNSGTLSCNADGTQTCNATPPSDDACTIACVPGTSCSSPANACGSVTTGTIVCDASGNGTCSADTAPDVPVDGCPTYTPPPDDTPPPDINPWPVGTVSIKDFYVSPNTINPASSNLPNSGICNFKWDFNTADDGSSCSLLDQYGNAISSFAPASSTAPTSYSTSGTNNELTYQLSCSEADPNSGEVASTTNKYATCYINSNYQEVNPTK